VILYLLRHAEAEVVSSTGHDADRRLTVAGRKRMRLVAKAIAKMNPRFDAILASPLVRSRQTADLVAEACGFKKDLVETKCLLPNANPEEILHELGRLGAEAVLLVGHQPHFGKLAGRLASGRSDVEIPLKKAGLAVYETGADGLLSRAELKLFLPPRLLESLT
jgi:phosphohistidine phosphatase